MSPPRPHVDCGACAEVAGQSSAPGGVILDDGLWFVSHHTGSFTDPGELIVKTRRHCESLAELTSAQARARKTGLLRNPSPADRAAAAERVRQEWR